MNSFDFEREIVAHTKSTTRFDPVHYSTAPALYNDAAMKIININFKISVMPRVFVIVNSFYCRWTMRIEDRRMYDFKNEFLTYFR